MTDKLTGLLILVPKKKHGASKGKNKRLQRRVFHDNTTENIETMRRLATNYTVENDEDFLIVQVVDVIRRPKNKKTGLPNE